MSFRALQLRPISTSHYYTSGDVTIHAGVAIAPGVLIQADPNSRIVIKSGACIGIGAILHASNGLVEVGEGANIGAEVLLVGQVQIGGNACVGAATTIINSTIAQGQIIPPGSLIGDLSRPATQLLTTDTVIDLAVEPPAPMPVTPTTPVSQPEINPLAVSTEEKSNVNVYGQTYVNRMFVKMFPHHPRGNSEQSDSALNQGEDPWAD
jgi:carbon dioxide concentrating mechanism protein CcmN